MARQRLQCRVEINLYTSSLGVIIPVRGLPRVFRHMLLWCFFSEKVRCVEVAPYKVPQAPAKIKQRTWPRAAQYPMVDFPPLVGSAKILPSRYSMQVRTLALDSRGIHVVVDDTQLLRLEYMAPGHIQSTSLDRENALQWLNLRELLGRLIPCSPSDHLLGLSLRPCLHSPAHFHTHSPGRSRFPARLYHD